MADSDIEVLDEETSSTSPGSEAHLRKCLGVVGSSVPRKWPKFQKFVKNTYTFPFPDEVIRNVWASLQNVCDLIEEAKLRKGIGKVPVKNAAPSKSESSQFKLEEEGIRAKLLIDAMIKANSKRERDQGNKKRKKESSSEIEGRKSKSRTNSEPSCEEIEVDNCVSSLPPQEVKGDKKKKKKRRNRSSDETPREVNGIQIVDATPDERGSEAHLQKIMGILGHAVPQQWEEFKDFVKSITTTSFTEKVIQSVYVSLTKTRSKRRKRKKT